MNPGRILHIVWAFQAAGAEKIARSLLAKCAREGWEAHACALAPSNAASEKEWEAAGIRLHQAYKRTGFDLTLAHRLRGIIRGERISILHTHNAVNGLYGGWAAPDGVRHVHTEHSNVSRDRFWLRRFRARSLKRSTVIAVSRKVAATLARSDHVPASGIRVIYNGVSVPPAAAGGSRGVFEDLGIAPGTRLIGTVGNLRAVKDHRTLLAAYAPIARESADSHLVIVGEGVERSRLEAEIRNLKLEGRVSLPGQRGDIAGILAALDVFVLSSKSEGLPLALLEAMAAGKPSVSTAVGGIPEAIRDGENGLLVPAESPKALTRAIRAILADRTFATRLGRRAKETAEENFSEDRMFQEYLRVYRELS